MGITPKLQLPSVICVNMKCVALSLIFCAVMAHAAISDPWPTGEKPWFCHSLDCPYYKVMKNTSNYELRSYPSYSWSSTMIHSTNIDTATETGFMRLFGYIEGANVQKTKVEMATPVLTQVTPGQGPACNSTFVESFYFPYKWQQSSSLPQPTNPDVFTQTQPARNVAVKSFAGYAHQTEIVQMVDTLQQELVKDSVRFNGTYFF